MKRKQITFIFLFSLSLTTIFSCKKAVKDAVQNAVTDQEMQLLTNGSWTITKYSVDKTDSTFIFAPWKTVFNNDYSFSTTDTVHSNSYKGVWSQPTTTTFTCKYNTAVPYPLTKIAATWNIYGVLLNSVNFERTELNGARDTLFMIKR